MSVIPTESTSKYVAYGLFKNPHFHTIFTSKFRTTTFLFDRRERMETNDGDFIDIDLVNQGSNRLVVLLHGLEGSSQSTYITGMAKHLTHCGYDVAAINFRGCSGEPNRLISSYHSGKTDDVLLFIQSNVAVYKDIFVVGFSLGGNIASLLSSRDYVTIVPHVKAIVAISTPLDLANSCNKIMQDNFGMYNRYFMKKFKSKMRQKMALFGNHGKKLWNQIIEARTVWEFDEVYTAPIHGFHSAQQYYDESSALYCLESANIPILLIHAQDDPFLAPTCFPQSIHNPLVELDYPKHGGHVGFAQGWKLKQFYTENKTEEFFRRFI